MKRLLSLILAFLLLFGLTAQATSTNIFGYTLDEKLPKQLKTSGFRGTATATVTGDGIEGIDPAVWAQLKALLPLIQVDVTSTVITNQDPRESTLEIRMGDKVLSKSTLVSNKDVHLLKSDLLSANAKEYFGVAADFDLLQLLTAGADQSAWPELWRPLLAVQLADEKWQAEADALLAPYLTRLGIWMEGFAVSSVGTGSDNVNYSQLTYTIPATSVKAQIKQLLMNFYADTALITKLREVMTAQESAAYLESSMMTSFFTMLDNLALEGNVTITRRHSMTGAFLMDRITLPFASSHVLDYLTIEVTPGDGGTNYNIEGEFRQLEGSELSGTVFSVNALALSNEEIYTGDVRIELPVASAQGDFTVAPDAGNENVIAFAFNLSNTKDEDSYDQATDTLTGGSEMMLVIKPVNGGDMHTHVITLRTALSSKSSERASTSVVYDFTWQDTDTNSTIAVNFNGKTTGTWSPTLVSDLTKDTTNVINRLDLMSPANQATQMERITTTLMQQLVNLLTQLLSNGLG